jgi:TPR repeat protein
MGKTLRPYILGFFLVLIFLLPIYAQDAAPAPNNPSPPVSDANPVTVAPMSPSPTPDTIPSSPTLNAPAIDTNSVAANPIPSSQAPDDVIKKLSDLTHAGKYPEAQQLTAGLLLAYPDDQRLIKAKTILDKLLASASPTDAAPSDSQPANSVAQPATSGTSDELTGADKVEYDSLIEMAKEAQQNTDLDQQKASLLQFMNESLMFLQKHPEQMLLWELRAVSALIMNDPANGYQAGQKLLATDAADSNDPKAQEILSKLKIKGWLDKNNADTQALKLNQERAAAGDSQSMDNLGGAYYEGNGVDKDYAQAFKWFQKGADAGNSLAMVAVGNMYYYGKGVDKDYAEALNWYQKAAQAGNDVAMDGLGNMYSQGVGVDKDYAQALKWFQKAADAGNKRAMMGLGNMNYSGLGVETNYAQALTWYKKAAEAGYSDAMGAVGGLYYHGLGVDKDETQALKWYQKAADVGNSDAMVGIGDMYFHGWGVDKDEAQALKWFKKAADAGNAIATMRLKDPGDAFGGIGAQLAIDEESHKIKIVAIVPNGSASKAGLAAGLLVDTVDGVSTKGKILVEASMLIRGPVGTKVTLGLIDPKSGSKSTVELTREKFQQVPPQQ